MRHDVLYEERLQKLLTPEINRAGTSVPRLPGRLSMIQVSRRTVLMSTGALVLAAAIAGSSGASAADKVLKIGQLGVMSGAEASWGLVNKFSALATAEMWNEKGGVEIGGDKYKIEIVSVDDRNDPKLAVSGAERLAGEGIRYIIGPNTDTTTTSVRPIIEKNKSLYFPYAQGRANYALPADNAVLGMVAGYQVQPVIYKTLKEQRDVKTVAFLARNDTDGLYMRDEGVKVAQSLGLEVVAKDDAYEATATDFFPIVGNIVSRNPDLIVMSSVAPAHAPQIMRAAREMGYTGLFGTESAQDMKIINEVAGEMGNGLISIGGASTPEIRSPYMEEFIDRYTKIAGEWNDEAGTKAYALEMILGTLQKAGPAALEDVEVFKAAIPDFEMKNPFLKEDSVVRYVGVADFGHQRQIGVPMVITETKDGELTTLSIGSVSN